MPPTPNYSTPTGERQPGIPQTPASRRPARRDLARLTTAAGSTVAVLAGLLVGGSSAAWAAGARFVPEATDAGWDGTVATVVFQETGVALADGFTTISVEVTGDVDAVCKRGESTLNIHRSVSALEVDDYPVKKDGTVTGIAEVPLQVTGLRAPGFSCVIKNRSITVVLEDFTTGATLIHKS